MIVLLWLVFFFLCLFLIGCSVGSFLNVVIYRLPRRKNLFWPSSRCGSCFVAIAPHDNLPLLAYWRLRGRCRSCGATFSSRYFFVELLTGIAFLLIYLLEVGRNLHGFTAWGNNGLWYLEAGRFAPGTWPFFLAHATLAGLLLSAIGCLFDTGRVPLALGITGAVVGLSWCALYPWPAPASRADSLQPGFVPWPVWWPLPAWVPAGSEALGIATGLVGILGGQALVRLVVWLRTRSTGSEESHTHAVAVLLLLAGGFLGWQPLLVALALAVLSADLVRRFCATSEQALGLALAGGLVVVWFGWRWLGPWVAGWLHVPALTCLSLVGVAAGLYFLIGGAPVVRTIARSGGSNGPSSPLPAPPSSGTRPETRNIPRS